MSGEARLSNLYVGGLVSQAQISPCGEGPGPKSSSDMGDNSPLGKR